MAPTDPRIKRIAEKSAKEYDTIIAQRTVNPAPTEFWKSLRGADAFLVYETDDDLASIPPSNIAHRFFSQPLIRHNYLHNLSIANRVTVSTEPLARALREIHPDVRVCPNAVPDWLLDHERPRRDRFTVGWGGSKTHDMDFAMCRHSLAKFLGHNPDVQFHCIGVDYADWMKLPEKQCRFTKWTPTVPDFFRTIDYDVGIAPLAPHAFNESKSYIKALECAALGIPVIASNVYPYKNFIKHGETGFIVKYDHEWGKYLRLLKADERLRLDMGEAAKKVAAKYTISKLTPIWKEALTP
jgi:glycosyltransferase involved in cell wall biosynthesis